MGKVTGFLEIEREDRDYQPVADRVKHWHEFVLPLPEKEIRDQAARCMDCGVPYCHGTSRITGAPTGCPVNNQIPDWNDLVYRGNWDEAARNLHSTNNFPEFTGRVCPAPCEASCTLNIDENPVTIKTIECEIADRAIAQGLKPDKPQRKTGKKVAVVGSGPAGLACAQQLARAGHDVHVYERWAKAALFLTTRMSARMSRPTSPSKGITRSCSPAAARSRAICQFPDASSRACISPWISCRSRIGA